MLLTTLLLSTVSANAASAGCFNGGAFVGAQAGFLHAKLNQEADAKNPALNEADAKKQVKLVIDALNADPTQAASKDAFDKLEAVDKDNNVKIAIDLSQADTDDKIKAQYSAAYSKLETLSKSIKTAKTVQFVVLLSDTRGVAAGAKGVKAADLAVVSTAIKNSNEFKAATSDAEQTKAVAALMKDGAEQKYSSNNGFAGIHAGYLGRVNDKFLVGGLVEGNWVFGQDMKVDSKAIEDTNARFNVNVFLRAMFNMTEKFMVGADIGFSGQEIRQRKPGTVVASGTKAKSSDKESKWFWNPAARLVLGVALTENILATAHFGGVFPMMKQDSLDKSVKAKYSNFHGGVGISYAFGG